MKESAAAGSWTRHAMAAMIAAAAIAAGAAPCLHAASKAPPVGPLVDRVADYVSHYQTDFAFVIADESTSQQVADARGRVTRTRATSGEFFITYLAAVHHWVAVHDVTAVDGAPVPDHEDLADLLRHDSIDLVARELLASNARFNIGTVVRNFNEPTLALLVFDALYRSGFTFSLAKTAPAGADAGLVTLALREHGPGTIVRGENGHDVPMRGEIAIEPDTGRIHQMHITLHDGPVTADLTTTFTADARLGLWVPTTFTERYALNRRGQHEVTTCETTYTNDRRFETSGRMIE